MEYHIIFVCLMGMGTVFFGLICLILLTRLLGRLVGASEAVSESAGVAADTPVSPSVPAPAMDRAELIAAISAAIAEDLGTDITGIRILSVRQL